MAKKKVTDNRRAVATGLIRRYGVRGAADALADAIDEMVDSGQPVPFGEGKGNNLDVQTARWCAVTLKGQLWPNFSA